MTPLVCHSRMPLSPEQGKPAVDLNNVKTPEQSKDCSVSDAGRGQGFRHLFTFDPNLAPHLHRTRDKSRREKYLSPPLFASVATACCGCEHPN